MDHAEQIDSFTNDLESLVNRYRQEYTMTYAAMIGVLVIEVDRLAAEANEPEEV